MESLKIMPEYNPESVVKYFSLGGKTGRFKDSELIMNVKKHLSAIGWSFSFVLKAPGRKELRYRSPAGKKFISLIKACETLVDQHGCYIRNDRDVELEKKLVKDRVLNDNDNRPKKKIRVEDVENNGKKIKDGKRMMESGNKLKPKKVIRKTEWGSRRRCVPALLIEKGVVLRGSKVSYKKKDGMVIAKGRMYDEGIQCNCCGLFFLLSKFEAHAGSTYHRPAAYIFLDDDNRSLLDCQAELNLKRENKPFKVSKSTTSADGNDEFCSFCKDGGELLLCDSCTSSFHSTCVGLKGVPDSDFWFCPSCSCRICHQGGQISKLTTNEQIKCVQCEHYFHISCLKKLGFSVSIDSAKWLCSEKCERINSELMGILGKPNSLSVDNLSWSLLKFENDEKDLCKYTESYSKLLVALDVMHECFEPVKHPWSENDLVDDVIFNKSSKRWSFEGFFTAVLEKDEEMITVVSLRIHGSKVAEIPLVATRFRYRKLGMCRILMNELERKLGVLGVERLVLPAVPETITTWTKSFGFSVMTEEERLNVVEYKFLEFPGTIKCQKMLKKM